MSYTQKLYLECIKRMIDMFFAIIILAIFLPVLLVLFIFLKLEDPLGPFLFKQRRAGKKGEAFNIYKIRTMISVTHKHGEKLSDTERLLKSGAIIRKLSLDEIPQMINILKGEMSFIGPRPLPVRYLPYYTEKEFTRHNVLPGISGLAQVKGRNLAPWDQRFSWDVDYVKNVSFLLDLKILVLTVLNVIKREKIVLKDDNPLQDLDKERGGRYESAGKS